jgi:hypothetical protein
MKINIILFILLFTLNVRAGNIVWEKEFDSTSSLSNASLFQLMRLSTDSSLYSAGYGIKLGSFDEADSTHLVVTRFNVDGEIYWEKKIPSKHFDYFNLLDSNNSGGIEIISSYTKNWVGDLFGAFYPHIIRFDNKSNVLFDDCDTIPDGTPSLIPFLLFKKDNQINAYHYYSKKYYYLYEKRFTSNGSLLSNRIIDSNESYSIKPKNYALANDGSYLIEVLTDSAYTHSKLYFFEDGSNLTRIINIERNRPYGIQSMIINEDSEIIMLGRYKMPPDDSLSFVWRLDRYGNFIEEKILPLTNKDIMGKIKQTQDKGYIILGRNFMSPYYCQYITKLDKNFKIKHQFAMNCDSSDYKFLYDFLELNDGSIIVCGSLHSNPFVARIDGLPVSVGYENEINHNIILSPNPACEYINIRLDDVILSEVKDLKIYNTLGECVLTPLAFGEGPGVRLDISALTPGLYFVSINNGKELLTGSFIVLR